MVQVIGDQNVVMPLSSVDAAAASHSREGGYPSNIARDLRAAGQVNRSSLKALTVAQVNAQVVRADFISYGYGVNDAGATGSVVAIVVPDVFFEALQTETGASVAGPDQFRSALRGMILSAALDALDRGPSLAQRLE